MQYSDLKKIAGDSCEAAKDVKQLPPIAQRANTVRFDLGKLQNTQI